MVGDDIQLSFEDCLVAEPLTDIPHVSFEIQIRITQFYPRISNIHLTIRVFEVDRRDIDGFGQPLRYIHLAGLEVHLESRVPLEQDVLFPAFEGKLAKGDYIVFENTGGYSNVLKPPFIRPDCAMVVRKPDGEYMIIKKPETYEDIFRNYVFEGGE